MSQRLHALTGSGSMLSAYCMRQAPRWLAAGWMADAAPAPDQGLLLILGHRRRGRRYWRRTGLAPLPRRAKGHPLAQVYRRRIRALDPPAGRRRPSDVIDDESRAICRAGGGDLPDRPRGLALCPPKLLGHTATQRHPRCDLAAFSVTLPLFWR